MLAGRRRFLHGLLLLDESGACDLWRIQVGKQIGGIGTAPVATLHVIFDGRVSLEWFQKISPTFSMWKETEKYGVSLRLCVQHAHLGNRGSDYKPCRFRKRISCCLYFCRLPGPQPDADKFSTGS